jgi:hypothetical protein
LHFDTDLLRQEAADAEAEAGGGAPAVAAVSASVMSKSTASVSNASRRRTTSTTTRSRRCWYLYHFCYSFVLPQLLWIRGKLEEKMQKDYNTTTCAQAGQINKNGHFMLPALKIEFLLFHSSHETLYFIKNDVHIHNSSRNNTLST